MFDQRSRADRRGDQTTQHEGVSHSGTPIDASAQLLRARQQLNRGYSDGLARGIEIVVTPLVFGALGWLLDRWLGTGPFLAVIFGVFGVAGIFAKLWIGYDRDMIEAQAGKPWTRGGSGPLDARGAAADHEATT